MGRMLQVRNIPERLHRELRRRAKARGQTLTDYVQEVLEREVARPPAEEVFDRIESRRSVDLDIQVAELIRQERGEREGS
jgi:plasmid stability protein